MPWITRQNDDDEYCVVEVDDEEREVEEVICFATKAEADEHRAELVEPEGEALGKDDLRAAMVRGDAISMREYFASPIPTGNALSMEQVLTDKEAILRADAVMDLCYAFMDVTWNIMWAEDVTDKVGAIASAANELGKLIPEFAQRENEQSEEEPMAIEAEKVTEVVAEVEPVIVPIAEGASLVQPSQNLAVLLELTGHVIEAAEDPNENRRGPLEVKTVYIASGAGNQVDAHYYRPEVLETAAAAGKFNGIKMYLTNHVEAEHNVRNEAGFTKDDAIYDAELGGVVGTAIVTDPDYAEKTRNLRDVKRLDMLHDSIYGYGTSESGEVDGEEYNVVTELTSLEAIDWVSRAGAGGRALQAQDLAETYKKVYGETEPVAEVEIEEEEPVVQRERVDVILADFRGLPASVKGLLAERQYVSEDAVTVAATEMVTALEAELGGIDNPAVSTATEEPWTPEMAEAAVREANAKYLPNLKA